MSNKGFDVLALNDRYEIVTLLNYTLLQWNRKFFESGSFSIEIPIELYSSEFKYIYTKDRPELGKIEQVNFYIKDGYKSVTISGYFLENELGKRIAYQNGKTTNINSNPSWEIQSGAAEDVAFAFFNAFKDVTYTSGGTTYSSNLDIAAGESLGRGKLSEHTRGNEQLSNKIYTILKPSNMSYRVSYDFATSQKVFSVWKGVDRTADNAELNNPVIFSTAYGNITEADLLIDNTDYRNSYIVTSGSESDKTTYLYAGNKRTDDEDGYDDAFIYKSSSSSESDVSAFHLDAQEELLEHKKELSLDFDTLEGSYEYREEFDLGDICSIDIPELDISVDVTLSEISEVIKKGVWSMTLGFYQN